MLLYGDCLTTHIKQIRDLLQLCRKHNITLGKAKFQLAGSKTNFAGYIIKPGGVAADPKKLEKITQFPQPTNLTDLRSFLGLVNQLSDVSSDIAATAAPFRPLLQKSSPFIWTSNHETAFRNTKRALVSPSVLAQFGVNSPTTLQFDASLKNGMGYALLQLQEGRWRLIQNGSIFLTDAGTRYAVIKLELAAVSWSMRKCQLYLNGLPTFTLAVDHQPLVTVLDKHILDVVENPKIQSLEDKISGYAFQAVWRKGKIHCIPDALSHAPMHQLDSADRE